MSFLTTLVDLFRDALEEPGPGDPRPPLPLILAGAGDQLGRLTTLTAQLGGGEFDRWLAELRATFTDVALRESLLIRVLQLRLPRVAESLTLIGVITADWTGSVPDGPPRSFGLDWDALSKLTSKDAGSFSLGRVTGLIRQLADLRAAEVLLVLLIATPAELVRLEHRHRGFLALPVGDNPGVSLEELLDLIHSPVGIALPPPDPFVLADAVKSPPDNGTWGALVVKVEPDPLDVDLTVPATIDGLDLSVRTALSGAISRTIDLGGWTLRIDGRAVAPDTDVLRLRINGGRFDLGMTPPNIGFGVFLEKTPTGTKDAFVLGDPKGTHFAIGKVSAGVRFALNAGEPAFAYVLTLDPVRFAVAADILGPVAMGLPLPAALTFASAVETSFLQGVGLSAQGAAGGAPAFGIEFSKNLGLSIGGAGAGLWVDTMLTRLEVAFPGRSIAARVIFRFDARAALGPVKATLTGAGVWIGPWTSGVAGVEPPTGIGIQLDAGPVSGGGFLKQYGPDKFGGALQLKVLGIGVFAYGLYEETPAGISLAAVLGIRLPLPGIQLGFGFAVSGFGGLIGINRQADLDALRERLQSGSAGDVLFTEDPVKNAPRILGDMDAILPRTDGVHVFGPTLQLNWAQLLKLDLGLFIELPGPRKIFVAGSARLVIGSESFALVKIRLDFIGGVDLTASLIFFDGMLVDSSVLGIIKITGGMALRIGYGGNPYFLFSIGGFHPGFNPGDLPIPALPRAGAGVDLKIVWFKQETYLAITSNTLQFGARTEAGVKIGPISVHGWFGFDALIQYRPFWFDAAVDAGMEASFAGVSFASIRVQGRLTGPGPLVLSARATVCLIFEVSKSVTITIDDNPPESLDPGERPAALVAAEMVSENVRVSGSDDDVVFAATDGIGARLIPGGTLIWEQKRVPLELALQRAEGRDLPQPCTVTVTVDGYTTADEYDLFGHGTYAKLTDAQALAAPTFIEEKSGFRLTVDGVASSTTTAPLESDVEIFRVPERRLLLKRGSLAFLTADHGALAAQRGHGAVVAHESAVVTVAREADWAVINGGRAAAVGLSAGGAFAAARDAGGTVIAPGARPVDLGGIA